MQVGIVIRRKDQFHLYTIFSRLQLDLEQQSFYERGLVEDKTKNYNLISASTLVKILICHAESRHRMIILTRAWRANVHRMKVESLISQLSRLEMH